jgi:hypothetical protein
MAHICAFLLGVYHKIQRGYRDFAIFMQKLSLLLICLPLKIWTKSAQTQGKPRLPNAFVPASIQNTCGSVKKKRE